MQMFECLTTQFMTEKGIEGMYPVAQTLLRFSTKEFLNALSLVGHPRRFIIFCLFSIVVAAVTAIYSYRAKARVAKVLRDFSF